MLCHLYRFPGFTTIACRAELRVANLPIEFRAATMLGEQVCEVGTDVSDFLNRDGHSGQADFRRGARNSFAGDNLSSGAFANARQQNQWEFHSHRAPAPFALAVVFDGGAFVSVAHTKCVAGKS